MIADDVALSLRQEKVMLYLLSLLLLTTRLCLVDFEHHDTQRDSYLHGYQLRAIMMEDGLSAPAQREKVKPWLSRVVSGIESLQSACILCHAKAQNYRRCLRKTECINSRKTNPIKDK